MPRSLDTSRVRLPVWCSAASRFRYGSCVRACAGGRRVALVAAGVVAGAALLAAVLGGRLVMDRSLALATAQLAPGDRQVQVTWSGATDEFPRLDRFVSPRIRALTGQRPAAAMPFREASIQRRLVYVRAADDLGRWVTLVSGKLPARCVPSHCEVLRLQGAGPIPSTKALNLIEVGRATVKPGAPIGPFVLPAPPTEMVARAVRYHTPQPSPIVIANGVAGLSHNKELETFYRSYAWFLPIERGDIHPWAIDAFQHRVQRLTSDIEASSDGFEVSAPTDELTTAAGSRTRRAATAAARRRRRRAAARVHNPRRRVAPPRRRRRAPAPDVVRRTQVADRAVHARGVDRPRCAQHTRRLGARRRCRRIHRHPSRIARCGRRVARAALAQRRPHRARHGSRRGSSALSDCAHARGRTGPCRVHAARRCGTRRRRGRGRGLGARVRRRPATHDGRRHERVPAAGTRLDRLRRLGACSAAARTHAPGARPRRSAGRSPWPRAPRSPATQVTLRSRPHLVASLGLRLRGRVPLDPAARPARRGVLRGPGVVCTERGLCTTRPGPARPCAAVVGTGAAALRQREPGTTLPSGSGRSTGSAWRPDFSARPLQDLGAAIAPRRDTSLRTTALPPGRRFAVSATTTGDDVAVRAIFGPRSTTTRASRSARRTAGTRSLRGRIPFVHASLAQIELDLLNGGRNSANAGTECSPPQRASSRSAPRVNGRPVRSAASWTGTGGISGTAAQLGYVLTPTGRAGSARGRRPMDRCCVFWQPRMSLRLPVRAGSSRCRSRASRCLRVSSV